MITNVLPHFFNKSQCINAPNGQQTLKCKNEDVKRIGRPAGNSKWTDDDEECQEELEGVSFRF